MEKDHEILKRLSSKNALPTLPGIAIKIIEAIRKEDFDLRELADIVTKDPPLTTQVLKTINSPFYGLPRKITSVFHAVNLLGATTLKNLALSFTLLKTFDGSGRGHFGKNQFWKNSLTAAIACQCMARKLCPQVASDAFTLGLIHDIGFLALTQQMPDQYNLVATDDGAPETGSWDFHEKEAQVFGFSHMNVGGYLLRSWGLPESFFLPVAHHHCPEDMESTDSITGKLARMLHLASIFIDVFNGSEPNMAFKLLDYYSRRYGYHDDIDVLEIADDIRGNIKAVSPIFDLCIEDEKKHVEIIESARTALIDVSMDYMNALIEQKRRIDELTQYVTLDSMTGLLNYQQFYRQLQKELSRASRYESPLSIIFCDIDNFKSINDTYGHLAGDAVIRAISDRLKEALRDSDSIARYGGEEFAIILPETSAGQACIVAERLRQMIRSMKVVSHDATIVVSISLGIASLGSDIKISAEEMVKRSDEALYMAKRTGKNRCCLFADDGPKPVSVSDRDAETAFKRTLSAGSCA
jgi:diguanylate cyclase (GGDEF)-like protein